MGVDGVLGGLEPVPERRLGPPGKLTEAARHRVFALLDQTDPDRPLAIDEQAAADLAELGATLPDDYQLDEEDVFEIWDINAAVFGAFLALETQWHVVSSMAGAVRTGLIYASVDVVLNRMGLEGLEPFDDIRFMEQAALKAFHEAAQ